MPREPLIRPLSDADAEAAGRLDREAFGYPDDPTAAFRSVRLPGRRSYGAFDSGVLVAKVVDREFDSWFGGVAVATAGIASVAVTAEYRGRGLLERLFDAALSAARTRGALISGLFPTQPGIYRRLGYELVSSFDTVAVPTRSLSEGKRPPGITVRRGTEIDGAAVLSIYERWASAQNGPLTRRGASFPDIAESLRAPGVAVTLAERDGVVVGYATWERGQHYGQRAVLEVTSVHADDPEAMAALLHTLGSFATAVPNVHFRTSGDDLLRLLLRSSDWRAVATNPYMIKVLDVAGLLSTISYPAAVTAEVRFAVAGDSRAENNGAFRLAVGNGNGRCVRVEAGGPDVPIFSAQGLSVLVAGAQSCANARFAGLVTGPTGSDTLIDALLGGRQSHIRNYY